MNDQGRTFKQIVVMAELTWRQDNWITHIIQKGLSTFFWRSNLCDDKTKPQTLPDVVPRFLQAHTHCNEIQLCWTNWGKSYWLCPYQYWYFIKRQITSAEQDGRLWHHPQASVLMVTTTFRPTRTHPSAIFPSCLVPFTWEVNIHTPGVKAQNQGWINLPAQIKTIIR